MANFSSDQKYLDKYGLSLFWDKIRQYIQTQIGGIDGTDVKLYPSGETNPTITDQIEKLWNSIGSGELEGGISGSIEAILGQYVKDIKHADNQTTPLKVVVNEGTEENEDFYTISLEDNGLTNTLSDLTTNRVSSLTPNNEGGSVTLKVDRNNGDVTLTVNSQELTNKLSSLETTLNEMVKSVSKAENGDGNYVEINIDPTTGDIKLSINDQKLVTELTSIKDNYAKTEDLPSTLPNPEKFTLTYRDGDNQENVIKYDGSEPIDVDFSLYYATTSKTATRVSNPLKVIDANGRHCDYNGGIMVDLTSGIYYAANSGKLGGQSPSYYGKQSDITTISQQISELEALTHVNRITSGDADSDLVKIEFSTNIGDVKASIDETNLSNKLSSIDNYTINDKKICDSPSLTGSDITLGTSVGDNYPSTTTLTASIQQLRETIASLGQVVELKGILTSLPADTAEYGNGDVVIVKNSDDDGDREYICYESNWYLLGYTDKLSQDVSAIKDSYVKSIKATGTGVTVTPNTSTIGDVTIHVDATSITKAIAELEANFGNYYTKTQTDTELDTKLAGYLPLSGGTLTDKLTAPTIIGNLIVHGSESNNDYIETLQYDNGLWGTESGKSPEISHNLASIKNAIKFNWYNDDWIIGNVRSGSASSDGFGIGMHKIKSDGTTVYQKNIFRLSPDGEIYLNGTALSSKYQAKGSYLTAQDHYKTSVTEGTAGTSSDTSGASLEVPYVTVNANGHVTGYGTHTHTITGFLTSETYKGTVTSVDTGVGLTGGTINDTGTIKCNLNSEDSLGTIGTTSKLYAVGVDDGGKLCVNVPWENGSGSSDTNTTYTFTGGTNGFTVTPSGGSAQTVTVTPSISKNVTYSGDLTANQVAVFNNTTGQIKASGYTIGASVPSGAIFTDTDTKVTQTLTSSNANYPILLAPSGQTATTTTTSYFGSGITCNPLLKALNVNMININKESSNGGIIYFGDKSGDEGYVYIGEDESDKLYLAGDVGITLKTGFMNEGGDIILDILPNVDDDRAAIRPYSSSNSIDIGRDTQRFYNGYFSNQVLAAGGFYESSDERLKNFNEGLKVDLDALSKLRKSYFTFKDKPDDLQIGVSAQEIQKLYPEVVIETSDGYLNVDYAKLSVIALAAVDQLNDKVKSLEDRLARLEKLLEK